MRTLEKQEKTRWCAHQIEGLVVWIIQIDILQLPPFLQCRFGSGFGWVVGGHGEGVLTLRAAEVIEH